MSSIHAASPLPLTAARSAPDDEEALSKWLSDFNTRIKLKEADRDKKALTASALAGQQITELHERRMKELQQAALLDQQAEEDAAGEAQEAASQEARDVRIAALTADLTEDQRQQWLQDDEEISKLEQELADRTGRMDTAGVEHTAWMEGYEARQRAEQELVDAEKRQAIEAEQDFADGLRKQLWEYEKQCTLEWIQIITEEVEPQWEELLRLEAQGLEFALTEARNHLYNELPPAQKAILDAMDDAKRTSTLDDLREMNALTQGLKRHNQSGESSLPSQTYLWDAVRVDASPELVSAMTIVRDSASATVDPTLLGEPGSDTDPLVSTHGSMQSGVSAHSGPKASHGGPPTSRMEELQQRLAALQGEVLQQEQRRESSNNADDGVEPKSVSASAGSPTREDKVALLEELVVEQARQLALLQQKQQT